MSSFDVTEDLTKEVNSSAKNKSLTHRIKKKHSSTLGNYKCNGFPFITAATSSSAEYSVTSSAKGKSIVSSISFSMERKNCIQYKPKKIVPCTVSAGQSTVIHLDNYTHFMAQRVTTTKTAIKKTEIISEEDYNSVPRLTTKVNSDENSNNKKLDMNEKALDSNSSSTVSKRGRKKPIALNFKESKGNKVINMKTNKPDNLVALKPTLKKTKTTRDKRVTKLHQARKNKLKIQARNEQSISKEETSKNDLEQLENLSDTRSTTSDSKILRPCVYTMQNRKCIFEISCRYLHSDFPCKYYYLNLPCPQGFQCQFMHNGPLEPKLIEALRNHILDLLSTNPSDMERHFVQQIHDIEDLSKRLHSFRYNQGENYEVIEVMDDGDEDPVLFIDENINDANMSEGIARDTITTDSLSSEFMHETDKHKSLQLTKHNLDMLYETFKESNFKIDEIGKKLKNLKDSSNMTPDKKILELQNIYELLKEQEKRLPFYERLNPSTATTAQITTTCDDSLPESNLQNEEQHSIVLVDPSIVNDIQTVDCVENEVTIIDDAKNMAIAEDEFVETINSNVPQLVGTEFYSYEDLPQQYDSELLINKKVMQRHDLSDNIEAGCFEKDSEINDFNMESNMDCGEGFTSNTEMILNISDCENPEPNTERTVANSNNFEKFQIEENKQSGLDKNCSIPTDANVGIDKNSELHNSLLIHNENLEMNTVNNEKEDSEGNVNDIANIEHIEEQSPPYENIKMIKPEKRNRIRLRSHTLHDTGDSEQSTAATLQPRKRIRARRLKLPNLSQKTPKKSNINECQINADVINKLIKHKSNVKSFENDGTECNSDIDKNAGCIRNNDSSDNRDVFLPTQISNESKSSQDPLTVECDSDNMRNNNNNIPPKTCGNIKLTNEGKNTPVPDCFKLPVAIDETEALKNPNLKRHISFQCAPTTSLTTLPPRTTRREQFNPQVVLTKLKTSYLVPANEKNVQVDSTCSYVNPIATSAILLNDKSTQKRHSLTSEYDLDSSLKGNKCLTVENTKSTRKVTIDRRNRKCSEQSSSDSRDGDFDIESSDQVKTHKRQQQHFHQHEYKELQDDTSDLRQEIEKMSKKWDLQVQPEQPIQQENKLEKTLKTTAKSLVLKNTNNMQHKILQKQQEDLLIAPNKHFEENISDKEEIENTFLNSHVNIEKNDEDGSTQSLAFKDIHESEEQNSTPSNKYANETTLTNEINVEYATYSSLFNKLSIHSTKRPIDFQNFSVNITPISSPTYGDNTIASPSPTKKSIAFHMGGEIDGRLTYPPMPYILHEIDLGKISLNKPMPNEQLKQTVQLDPRIYRTHAKKQLITMCKRVETISNSLVPITSSNTLNLSNDSSFFAQPTTPMISSFDPRVRAPDNISDISTQSLSHQAELVPYNRMHSTAVSPSSSMHIDIPNGVPLALQYRSTPQSIIQPQQQETPNMFLYGCLQRSPWYQSLMSTMKIEINQSISQLVRALNDYHRERLLNPEIVFDLFKIDCAGELLEIMRNLGVFVDANGVITEQRNAPSFGGRSCYNTMPVNATYSFIQQVLTPNTNCTLLPSSATCSTVCGGAAIGHVHVREPFVSCYIKAPELVQKHSKDSLTTPHHSDHDDNNSNRNYNCNHNDNNSNYNNNNRNYNCNRNDNSGNYNNNNNNSNNNNGNKRYNTQFKKPYDNNNSNNNSQLRSNQRYNNYNNNPRFMKPGSSSPTRSNSSPPNSPRKSCFDGGSFGSYVAREGRGGGGGGGARFNNNNRRFNNYNNKDNYNSNVSSWSSSESGGKRFNNKYQNNNSPPRNSSPTSSYQSTSPRAAAQTYSSPPNTNGGNAKKSDPIDEEEECWDSDN